MLNIQIFQRQINSFISFKTIWPDFCIVYPIDCFQNHMTWFLYCVPKLLLSMPFDLILSLCTQLTPFKTIWPDFCIVCTQLTPFKTIWPDFCIVYPNMCSGVNWVHNHKIRSNGLERSNLGTQYKNQVIWSWKESIGYTMTKLGQMVLKGVIWVHNAKIRSNGLERSNLGTQYKNQAIHNDKISNGLERSIQLIDLSEKSCFHWKCKKMCAFSSKLHKLRTFLWKCKKMRAFYAN